ncbi:hypothetical protein VC623_23655 [Citrobacter amalonaticus]|uniref:hypothetical protein n=1 Tax=Citrobacter amalonaticus TaxID=35703 RepID=UPI00292BEC4C|nr:hypothetical protein [Citrobacter amalonaticus]MDV0787595.1 hypothetical protein [Citrobacter amalonaticus]MEB0643659.1 hypothetical protein [Citrobacter amalonaticus]
MLPTPLSSCLLVYANPHQEAFKKALTCYLDDIFDRCKITYISEKNAFEDSKDILGYMNGYYTYGDDKTHSIGSLKVLHDLACEEDFNRIITTVLIRSGMSISEGIKLTELGDKIKTYYKMQDIVWPKDEEIFFENLRKQIDVVSEQALCSFLSSCQCKFDAETQTPSR